VLLARVRETQRLSKRARPTPRGAGTPARAQDPSPPGFRMVLLVGCPPACAMTETLPRNACADKPVALTERLLEHHTRSQRYQRRVN